MFGQNNAPQTQSAISFAGVSFDRRPRRLPLGDGVFEVVKMGTRKTPQNFDEFYAVLKCAEHSDTQNAGQVFEFSKVLQGLMFQQALREIGQLIMFSFGKEAASLPSQTIAAVLDKSLLSDAWASFNATQSIEGKSVVGNKVRIRGYNPGWGVDKATGQAKGPRINKRTGQPYEAPLPRYVFDVV